MQILSNILLPAIIFCFMTFRKENRWKQYLVLLILVELFSVASTLLVRFFFDFTWTGYEYTLLCAFISVGMSLFADCFFLKKKERRISILKALFVICLATAVYSSLTRGQFLLTSDTATATLLAKSQVEHASLFPATWNYANGDIWTITSSTFSFPFIFLLKNQSLARALGSALTVLVTVAGMIAHSRKLYKNDAWLLSVPLFLVFMAQGDAFFILHEAAYTLSMLWIVTGTLFAYKAKDTRKPRYLIPYIIVLFTLCVGGVRYVAEQALPIWLTCIFLIYIRERCLEKNEWKKLWKEILFVSSFTVLPALAGLGVYKWLCSWHNVNVTANNSMIFVNSLDGCLANLWTCMLNLIACFGFTGGLRMMTLSGLGNLVSILVAGIVCFIVPVLQGIKVREETREVQFFYTFGMIHNLIILVTAVLFGLTLSRYMLTFVFVNIIISSRYIYVYWIQQKSFMKNVWTSLFAAAAVLECVLLLFLSVGWQDAVLTRKAMNQELVDDGMTKGYATYWNAYKNEVFSDLKIRYGAVQLLGNDVEPFSWLVDEDVYVPDAEKSFLILEPSENNAYGQYVSEWFGEPEEIRVIDSYSIYYFNHDIAADFYPNAALPE